MMSSICRAMLLRIRALMPCGIAAEDERAKNAAIGCVIIENVYGYFRRAALSPGRHFYFLARSAMPRLFSASRISGTFHVMLALLLGAKA